MVKHKYIPGDFVPDFVCATQHNPKFHFQTCGGCYVFLSFMGSVSKEENLKVVEHVRVNHARYFNPERAMYFAVTIDASDQAVYSRQDMVPAVQFFLDFDRSISALYGAIEEKNVAVPLSGSLPYEPFTLVLDPMLRVIAVISLRDVEEHNKVLDKIIASSNIANFQIPAPVLMLPYVLEPELCKALIAYAEKQGYVEGGLAGTEKREYTNKSVKLRKDCHVYDEALHQALHYRVTKRVFPAIQRYFSFTPTWVERYVIGCYDGAEGGYFRAHRDNTSPYTKHRKFALSINLNTGEYEGGELNFPEFGTTKYSPPIGGAIIFASAAMHKVFPVTKGKRYVMPMFLYDDEGNRMREKLESESVQST